MPIVSHALLTEQGVQFSSIVTTSVQSATVALIGTSGGQLLKVLIEAGKDQKSRIYKAVQLTDGAPLLQVNKSLPCLTPSYRNTFRTWNSTRRTVFCI